MFCTPPLPATPSSTPTTHCLATSLTTYTIEYFSPKTEITTATATATDKIIFVIIPPLRTTEYVFSSTSGAQLLYSQTECPKCLVIVKPTIANPSITTSQVKADITDLIRSTQSHLNSSATATIMTIGEEPGASGHVIHETETTLILDIDSDDTEFTSRQLIFKSNLGVIQSEAFRFKASGEWCYSKCSFDYHYTMCAALVAFAVAAQPTHHLAVIGLGGGQLSMFINYLLSTHLITTIELDKNVKNLAVDHFGYRETDENTVQIQDGLDVNFPPNSIAALLLDVDTKDDSVGMACPPEPFISPEYLQRVKQMTNCIIINVSARDKNCLTRVCDSVKSVFGTCFVSEQIEGEVNVVVVGVANEIDSTQLQQTVAAFCERATPQIQKSTADELNSAVSLFKRYKKKTRGGE